MHFIVIALLYFEDLMTMNQCIVVAAGFSTILTLTHAQQSSIVFSIDAGAGLIYLLLVLFFLINFLTPVLKWIYLNYLERLVDSANKQVAKISKRISDRLSDVGRKASQSIRSG